MIVNGRFWDSSSALSLLRAEVDESAEVRPLSLKGFLSVAVASRYEFGMLTLLDEEYVLAEPVEAFTVDRLVADFAAIEGKTGKPAIAMVPELSPYFRKALIAKRVPFLLSGRQAFLPFVYLNLTVSKAAPRPHDFAPSTQAVFLALLFSDGATRTQRSLTEQLRLSPMSVSRAVDQLSSHKLINVTIAGRTGRLQAIGVPDAAEFYRSGMSHFGRAVKRIIYVRGKPPFEHPRSGLDALSRRTLLGPPGYPCLAAFDRRRSEFVTNQIDWRDAVDRADIFRVDLLRYDPSWLASDGMVDPVTMLLTIGEHDERIDQAIADYMKGFSWYSA